MSQSIQPAPSYGQAPGPEQPFNILSIVAFVLSVVGISVVAIILGHIGLGQTKTRGERGRGFAIAALIIGYVTLVLEILAVIAVILIAAGVYATSGVSYAP
ncbi:DUF4190 domain-containing protein [Naasia aerilata]|uniref:DUF4190 domain-containing protein n=1 Tax=Naasia aerilata TaxID=1162966 RepID=A0ABN6XMS5_9MICO|nr:DUF4190 domain-containing protein [Naasia aerilata]BDZ44986.1 hypothetical protein GCM10025866_08950 [Naasia aerilata]